jgi:hypothetical protein
MRLRVCTLSKQVRIVCFAVRSHSHLHRSILQAHIPAMAPTAGDGKKSKPKRAQRATAVDPVLAAEEAESAADERVARLRAELAQQELLVARMRSGQEVRQRLTADVRDLMAQVSAARARQQAREDDGANADAAAAESAETDKEEEREYDADFDEGAGDEQQHQPPPSDPDLLGSVLAGMLQHLEEIQRALATTEATNPVEPVSVAASPAAAPAEQEQRHHADPEPLPPSQPVVDEKDVFAAADTDDSPVREFGIGCTLAKVQSKESAAAERRAEQARREQEQRAAEAERVASRLKEPVLEDDDCAVVMS